MTFRVDIREYGGKVMKEISNSDMARITDLAKAQRMDVTSDKKEVIVEKWVRLADVDPKTANMDMVQKMLQQKIENDKQLREELGADRLSAVIMTVTKNLGKGNMFATVAAVYADEESRAKSIISMLEANKLGGLNQINLEMPGA